MPSPDPETNQRIESFFGYFSGVFLDCENLLNDQNYEERYEIAITVLFSILSLFSTSYCCGKMREDQMPENEKEFIAFLDQFWDSGERMKIHKIITDDGRAIKLRGAKLLWKLRNLFAHEFRQAGMTFPSQYEKEVILIEPIQSLSTGQTKREFGVHPYNLLSALRQMAANFKDYCIAVDLNPRQNIPFKELYIK